MEADTLYSAFDLQLEMAFFLDQGSFGVEDMPYLPFDLQLEMLTVMKADLSQMNL